MAEIQRFMLQGKMELVSYYCHVTGSGTACEF